MSPNASPSVRLSPCIGVCKLDDQTGLCLGCARSGAEIAAWSTLDSAGRDAVWQQLPERAAQLSLRLHLLPWSGQDILAWSARTMRDHAGTWVTGMPGASAEFPSVRGRGFAVQAGADEVTVATSGARWRLCLSERLCAFSFGQNAPIVIGFSRPRIDEAPPSTFTPLGRDVGAISAEGASDSLYDLGLGRRFSRFCLRTGHAELKGVLDALAGKPWQEVLKAAAGPLRALHPTRVVESPFCRIEIDGPNPPLSAPYSPAARTQFWPQYLVAGEEIPGALALPPYAAPVAIFYPNASSA